MKVIILAASGFQRLIMISLSISVIGLLISFGAAPEVIASNKDASPRSGSLKEVGRQKVIDFDGDVVEGVNKRPFDSLSETSDGSGRNRKVHLYKKRRSFRTEVQETIREMRYL